MKNQKKIVIEKHICFHCGVECTVHDDLTIIKEDTEELHFCCFGCKTIYELLNEKELCTYYNLHNNPGISQKNHRDKKYEILDRDDVALQYITFSNETQSHIKFFLPQIHCSSCVWLLENIHAINHFIIYSKVDFFRKEIVIIYDKSKIKLSQVAGILDSIGYEPLLHTHVGEAKQDVPEKNNRIIKIGVAGFCFGNIMLFSFPDYLAGGTINDAQLEKLFQMLSLALSLPVLLFSAQEFFTSAWNSIRKKYINIDVPIAIAISLTFIRSLYAIFIENHAGYFDSMSGIIFFMLIGRFFQDKTYKAISFERNYKSYFPLYVTKLFSNKEVDILYNELKEGDRILVRNEELVPADCILIKGTALVDYSFVTGETDPVEKNISELIYAGAKLKGGLIELAVIKKPSQSYLAGLWERSDDTDEPEVRSNFTDKLSRYFAIVVLALSFIAFIYWSIVDKSNAFDALITPMIVACPCAILLSATFTYGSVLSKLSRFGIYCKNFKTIDNISKITTIVFDKTGTITQPGAFQVTYIGNELSIEQKASIFSLANQSQHPYCKAIRDFLETDEKYPVIDFKETKGAGITARIHDKTYKIGSARFVKNTHSSYSSSFVTCNNQFLGEFTFKADYVQGLKTLTDELKHKYKIYLLSGDADSEKNNLEAYFNITEKSFNASPYDKIDFIKSLQSKNEYVMMVGDGLNDSGALLQSNVGIAVTADAGYFTPSSDAIMSVKQISFLSHVIKFAKNTKKIIIVSFIFSLIYNIVGLFFALQAQLKPVIAALLMPLSTITIILLSFGLTSLLAHVYLKKFNNLPIYK